MVAFAAALSALAPLGADTDAPVQGEADAQLAWSAPYATCPDASQVRALVVDMARRWPTAAELDVVGSVEQQPTQWQLALTVRVGEHVHTQALEAESCEVLAKATALIIAVSIDPIASSRSVEIPAAPRPPAPTPLPDPDPVVSPPRPPGERASRPAIGPRPFAGVGLAVGTGMTPGISGGPSLSLGLDIAWARLALEGRYWAPREVDAGGLGARVQAGAVTALACASTNQRIRPIGCLGLEAGALRAHGLGLGNPATAHFPRLAPVLRAGVLWQATPRLAITAHLEGAISAFEAVLVVGDVNADARREIYRSSLFGARAGFGLEFLLPRVKR